jgi:hypothetical protein
LHNDFHFAAEEDAGGKHKSEFKNQRPPVKENL